MYKLLLLIALSISLYSYELDKQTECLALNIYHEARGSNLADQAAVADVVLNRVNSHYYPNTICKVVKQAKLSKWHLSQGREIPLKNRCQFSWFCDGLPDNPTDEIAWEQAKLVAIQIYKYGLFRGISENSLFYHATYVDPYWASSYRLIGVIGKHKFYKLIKD